MSATAIAVQVPKGPYASPSAGQLDITMTAADTVNGNSFAFTGKEILIVENTDVSAHTFTLTSVADTKGRTGDITSYSIGAGKISVFNFRGGLEGWQQSDGTIHISANDATVKFAIIAPAS